MGARPSSFKKGGGGFLNNVQGSIADYEFTDTFPGQDGPAEEKDGFVPLYCVLTADVDGADEQQQTTLWVGNALSFEIKDDGKTLEPVDDKAGIPANGNFGKFIAALCENGFPENSLPDDDEPINYESILGYRVTFVQIPDEVAMAKAAKNYRKSGGKFNEKGQKKGKDGKYYNQTYLSVSEVLGGPDAEDEKPAKGSKSDKSDKGSKSTKGGKKSDEPSIDDIAKETLIAVVRDADGELAKAKLPARIQNKLGSKHPQREEVRKLVYTDEFLGREDGWKYNKKKQVITVEAE